MCRARFGLWRIVGRHDVCGIVVSDLLDDSGDGEQVWVVDETLEATATPGTCLASRLCRLDSFAMFAGATVPVSRSSVETALLNLAAYRDATLHDLADDPKLPGAIYRAALESGVFDDTAGP